MKMLIKFIYIIVGELGILLSAGLFDKYVQSLINNESNYRVLFLALVFCIIGAEIVKVGFNYDGK